MLYCLKLFYNDEKSIDVNLQEDDYKSFMKSLYEREVFWDKKGVKGFWTSIDQIRYLVIDKREEASIEEKKEEVQEPVVEEIESEEM